MSLHDSDQSEEIIANLKQRDAFEKWARENGHSTYRWRHNPEVYILDATRVAWYAWQAANSDKIARLERHLHEAEEAGRRLAKQLFEAERKLEKEKGKK